MASIMLQVMAVGTQTDFQNLLTCVRRPSSLAQIVTAMFVAVPLFAVLLAKIFDDPPVVRGAMLMMAISAAAPMLPKKLLKLGVEPAFAQSLSAVTTVLAIPLVPLMAALIGGVFSREVVISDAAVANTLAMTFLIPFAVGMALRAVLGPTATPLGEWAGTIGSVVLAALVVVLLIVQGGGVFPLLWRSLPLIVVFAGGSLLIGHFLGGPDPGEEAALAIATVTRHPGLAILMVTTNFPQARALPAILAIVLGCAAVAIPYTVWRKRDLALRPRPPLRAPA
jgi:BASS family bile acid:Na+ symporter